jgi:hypothetical protein
MRAAACGRAECGYLANKFNLATFEERIMAATPAPTSAASTSTISFPAVEEEILLKWKNENTFATQNKLSQERGDKVRLVMRVSGTVHNHVSISCGDSDLLLSAPIVIRLLPGLYVL